MVPFPHLPGRQAFTAIIFLYPLDYRPTYFRRLAGFKDLTLDHFFPRLIQEHCGPEAVGFYVYLLKGSYPELFSSTLGVVETGLWLLQLKIINMLQSNYC